MIMFQLIAVPLAAILFLRSLARFLRGAGPRWVSALSAAIWLAAGITILQPEVTNAIARFLGIGRGADLVLYVLALSFLASLVYFYHKYRQLSSDLTEIVRSLAIRDAEERWPGERLDSREPPAPTQEDSRDGPASEERRGE